MKLSTFQKRPSDVLLQILFFLLAVASFFAAWNGVGQAKGWKVALFGSLAVVFISLTITGGPNIPEYRDCERYSSFASSC